MFWHLREALGTILGPLLKGSLRRVACVWQCACVVGIASVDWCPYTKIQVEAAIGDAGMLEAHGGQAHGCRGGGFDMLPLQ